MSVVITAPEALTAAASQLADLGSGLDAAQVTAAARTARVAAAAEDEVSAAVAEVFAQYAQEFQALSAGAAGFHRGFVQALAAAASTYAHAEAATASACAYVLA
uniref:PE family protein n=1 Tax=Mycobacterium sp. Marseille-P9652 TaxID=2654950 RepID=UPI0012E8F62D